jgi:hypothetical protein
VNGENFVIARMLRSSDVAISAVGWVAMKHINGKAINFIAALGME